MINVFKSGGDWLTSDGYSYTVRSINNRELPLFLDDGWFKSIEDTKAIEAEYEVVAESGSDYEAELRDKIKALNGKPAGRSSIETLEKQLKELQNGSDS